MPSIKCPVFLLLQLIVTSAATARGYESSHGHDDSSRHGHSPASAPCSRVLPLRLKPFPSWAEYLSWRQTVSPVCATNQPIHPCVRHLNYWTCLPKLVVIGTQKGGTTGLRNMLIATGLFTSKYVQGWDGTKVYPESHYFGKNLANRGRDMSYLTMLENWVKTSGKFPSHVKWSDLADKHGFARKISIDVSPQYSLELVQHEIEWILRINPDAHFLLLARDPSAAFVSSTDMSICSGHAGAIDPPRHCGAVGCDFRPTKLFPTSKDILAATETCTPETIPCSLFYRQLKKLTAQNQEKELKYMLGGRHAGIYGYNGHGKWRYPWVLHQQWLQVVPRHQMHVIRSDYLWDEPQLALETIASLLKLPFKIPAVKNFETKPPSQTKCKCKDSGKMFKAFHAIIDRCQLREAISCSHFYSNELMQELMTSRFPYGSPPGKPFLEWNHGMNASECKNLGFAMDVRYDSLRQQIAV